MLTANELYEGVNHLYETVKIIDRIGSDLYNGVIVPHVCDEDIKEGYLQCNKCRLYTQRNTTFDELLEPALGNIYSCWAMLSHLTKEGFTITGIRSILVELSEAKVAIGIVIEEMENMLSQMTR
jgi:hypothetical protein